MSVTVFHYIISNYRKRKTENFCQENLSTFFKYHVDSVRMSQHYCWTQLENHLSSKMSSMGRWSDLNENFHSYGESKEDHEISIGTPVIVTLVLSATIVITI